MNAAVDRVTRPGDRRCEILEEVSDALRVTNEGATSIEVFLAGTSITRSEVIIAFGSTDELVIALVEKVVDFMLEPLDELPTPSTFVPQLIDYARRVTGEYANQRLKNLYRIAITDATRTTSMRMKREFYRRGPNTMHSELARYFRSAQLAGVGLELDSRRLAGHFMAFLRVGWDLSGKGPQADRPHATDDVGRLVEWFLQGIQTRPGDAREAVHER